MPSQASSRAPLAVVLGGCATLVALAAILAFTAFVTPGFLRSTTPPAIDDPLALLPANSNWAVGADLEQARARGMLEPVLSFMMKPPPGVPGEPLPAALADVVRDGDSLLIAGTAGDDRARPVVIVVTRVPVAVDKVKQACNAGPVTRMHGFQVYRADLGKKGTAAWLAFPGERLVLLSEMSEGDFGNLLAAALQHTPHPAIDLIQEARVAPLWGTAFFDEPMKKKLNASSPADMAQLTAQITRCAARS